MSDPACTIVSNLIRGNDLMIDFFGWMVNADGTPTQEFLDWIGSRSTGINAPPSINATDDREDDITVTWSSVSGAVSYSLYRGETSDTSQMTLIQDNISGTTYVDTGVEEDKTYWYAVRAYGSSSISELSAATDGKRVSSKEPSDPIIDEFSGPNARKTVVIPPGKTAMEVWVWGGGGYGGGGVPPWTPIGSGTPPSGGGGGSGSVLHVSSIPVESGEVYEMVCGAGGSASAIYRGSLGSSEYLSVPAGGNGGDASPGNTGTPGQGAGTPGTNLLGGSQEADSSDGNAAIGSTGGEPVVIGSRSGGRGADGSNVTGARPQGSPGRIRYIIT